MKLLMIKFGYCVGIDPTPMISIEERNLEDKHKFISRMGVIVGARCMLNCLAAYLILCSSAILTCLLWGIHTH